MTRATPRASAVSPCSRRNSVASEWLGVPPCSNPDAILGSPIRSPPTTTVTGSPPVYRAPCEWATQPLWPVTDPDAPVDMFTDMDRTVPAFQLPIHLGPPARVRRP